MFKKNKTHHTSTILHCKYNNPKKLCNWGCKSNNQVYEF